MKTNKKNRLERYVKPAFKKYRLYGSLSRKNKGFEDSLLLSVTTYVDEY